MEIEMEAMPVDNVGIMQGFLEMMNEDDDLEEGDDEMEAGEMLGRTPDSPEILMNNLRGDMRSIDARRDELADMVGYAAAAETPDSVLAMLQPMLAQQGIGAMVPPGMGLPPGEGMPPGPSPVSPVGAPNMPNVPNVPNMPSEMMAPMQPMPAGGIGDMAPPVQMADGGLVGAARGLMGTANGMEDISAGTQMLESALGRIKTGNAGDGDFSGMGGGSPMAAGLRNMVGGTPPVDANGMARPIPDMVNYDAPAVLPGNFLESRKEPNNPYGSTRSMFRSFDVFQPDYQLAAQGYNKGGIVQRFSDGSTPAAVTSSEDAAFFPPETVQMARQLASTYLTPKTIAQTPFDLAKETAAQQAVFKNIMGGAEQDDLSKSQLLLDLASRAFGYAANVDDQGKPLRGSALSRLAGATRTLPQTMSQFIAQKSKQDQAIKLAALQAAQKKEERGLETAQAQDKARFDFAMEVLKADARKKNFELLSPEQARNLGLPLDRGQVYQREKGTNDISPVGSPTTIIQNMPAQKADVKYGEGVADLATKKDFEIYESAIEAPKKIENHNDTIRQIQKADVTTGFGAELIKNVNRARALILNDEKAGKRVSETEKLEAMLGSQVFTMLPALGLGARGMDTPAERQFMVAVLTGDKALNKNTLLEMANIRRNLEIRAIQRYNDLVESGEFDAFFEARKRKKRTVEIPSLVPINPVGAAGDPRRDPAVEGALGGGR